MDMLFRSEFVYENDGDSEGQQRELVSVCLLRGKFSQSASLSRHARQLLPALRTGIVNTRGESIPSHQCSIASGRDDNIGRTFRESCDACRVSVVVVHTPCERVCVVERRVTRFSLPPFPLYSYSLVPRFSAPALLSPLEYAFFLSYQD